MLDTFSKLFGGLVVEVVILVVYPLLHDNTSYLLVVIVECNKFTRFLVYTDVDISENSSLLGCGKLVGHLLDGTLDLLDSLL